MEKGIMSRINDIDKKIFKTLQFFEVMNVFLENKSETNEDFANALAIAQIAHKNLEKAYDEIDELVSDLHIELFAE